LTLVEQMVAIAVVKENVKAVLGGLGGASGKEWYRVSIGNPIKLMGI